MPIKWTDEQKAKACEEILARVRSGLSLRAACDGDDWMPAEATFRLWCDSDADLSAQYTSAREARAELLFEQCLDIADQYEQAEEKLEGGTDHINRARLRIDTRKWMLGKMQPKKYGDKLAIGGADDLPPIQHEVSAADILGARLDAIAGRTTGDPKPE